MSYPKSCHPGPGHHHFLPGLFQKSSNCLEDVSQLPSLLLYSSISTRQPKGLFKMKQHHFNSLFKILSGFPSHSESKLKSSRSPTSRNRCTPCICCTTHPLPPSPVLLLTPPHWPSRYSSQTLGTPSPSVIPSCFTCFLFTAPYPLEFKFYGGRVFWVFGHWCVPNALKQCLMLLNDSNRILA